MATVVVTAPSPVQAVEKFPLTTSPQVYAANHDRAERADPSREMQQSGIRNRGVESRVSTDGIQNDDTHAGTATLAPADEERARGI
jgi:hypothetical protein